MKAIKLGQAISIVTKIILRPLAIRSGQSLSFITASHRNTSWAPAAPGASPWFYPLLRVIAVQQKQPQAMPFPGIKVSHKAEKHGKGRNLANRACSALPASNRLTPGSIECTYAWNTLVHYSINKANFGGWNFSPEVLTILFMETLGGFTLFWNQILN